MRRGLGSALVVIALATASSSSVRAEAPAAPAPCTGKVVGERCAAPDGRSGTCRATTCTRFEHWKTPATTTSYDCVQCLTEGDASASATGKLAKNAASAGCGASRTSGARPWGPGALGVMAAIGALVRRRGGEHR